jgi:Dolichyl-phosphate-mannose-protein mannosyltransferase
VRIPLLLYGLALAVRAVLIWHFPEPAYPDASYYVDVARALHDGQGFNVDFIWIFAEVGGRIPADPVLPIASNAHWMPLASMVQVPFLAIFGNVAWASAAPFALIGSLAAPLTWAVARDAGARPWVQVGAGVLVAFPLLSAVYLVQPDNFSLYQPLVVGSLWLGARGLKGSGRAFAGAGLLAGLATLSRNDGLLVLAALGLAFAWDRWHAWRSGGIRRPAISLAAAISCVALFVLVMAPWWARQLAVFGSLSPSTASGRVLFIRDISEWDSITTPATLDHLLGMGPGPLIASRIGGLVAAVMIYVTLVAGFVLAPFMVIGGWARRRSVDFGPFFAYAGLLFTFSALISAVHVPGGTFIHSAIALAPHSYILALEGIAISVTWIARRRPAWDADAATRFFGAAAIGFAILCTVAGSLVVHANWANRAERFRAVAGALDAAGAAVSDRVMSIDASGTKYWTGRGGVVLVNDPIDTIEEVARAYKIRWLVLDAGDSVKAAAPILGEDARPAWIGPPVYTEPGTAGGTQPVGRDRFSLGVYPVCLDPTDRRCAPAGAAS